MKPILSLFLSLCLIALVGCGDKAPPAPDDLPPEDAGQTIHIGGLTGPTSIGMVQLMDKASQDNDPLPYDFHLVAGADALVPKLVKGDLQLAAIPANLAAVLYENTDGAICVLAINTFGVLSIVETGGQRIQSIADLKGQTIYATGKGTTPEYTLRYLLEKNGLDPDQDVTIEFRSEPTEVVSLLASQESGIAMLPQPFVTVAQSKLDDLRVAIDLTTAWDDLGSDSALITGVMVARRDFVAEHPELVAQFLDQYDASITFAKTNLDEAARLTEEFGIVSADVAIKAIPHCNLTFLTGQKMKTALSAYLEVLYEQNPASVGQALPDDAFYFDANT